MLRPCSFLVALVALFVLLLGRSAFAQPSTPEASAPENSPAEPSPTESGVREGAAEREVFEGFGEAHVSVRTMSLAGDTLAPGVGTETASPLTLPGDRIGTLVVPAIAIGGGFRLGPVVIGAELGGGASGGASTATYRAKDIDVRPSGFVGMLSLSAYAGVMITPRGYRLRLDGVLGTEMVSLGMERPAYDDTRVRDIAATRATFGPRARVDFLLRGGGAVGIFAAADALHPGSVAIGVVLTTL
ncbi:MAG: hypothetical protein JST00_15555 [Deltaproteobacteria bacterium]|nr:hypothetical protein [Deltaproteobacteria bacterium]